MLECLLHTKTLCYDFAYFISVNLINLYTARLLCPFYIWKNCDLGRLNILLHVAKLVKWHTRDTNSGLIDSTASLYDKEFFSVFVLRERKGGSKWGVRERGRGRGIILSRLCTLHLARRGSWSFDHETMTGAKIKIWTFNRLSHEGAPIRCFNSSLCCKAILWIFLS